MNETTLTFELFACSTRVCFWSCATKPWTQCKRSNAVPPCVVLAQSKQSIIIASIESFGSVHCCCCAKERDASLPGSMISWCCRVPWRCGLLQLISLLAFPAAAHLKSTGIGCICVRPRSGGAVASPETETLYVHLVGSFPCRSRLE